MDIQQLITLVLGVVALYFVGRRVWADLQGFINPSDAGGCPGCGGCDAAMAAESEAPAPKKTPLLSMQTKLPPHLERLRRSEDAPGE